MRLLKLVPAIALVFAGFAHAAPQMSDYDASLANRLGADDYGMRHYVMAFLKTGPVRNKSKEASDSLMRAHLANIHRLAKQGKLILAGPFLDKGALRGIYLFDVTTVKEARELTATDPAVKAGVFVMELHPWYGSAALMQVNDISTHISKKTF